MVQLVSVVVPPALYRPPPFPVVEPPEMVRPVRVAVTPLSTWNTWLVPPPLTVTPAAGPVIVSAVLRIGQLQRAEARGEGDGLRRGEGTRGVEDNRVGGGVGDIGRVGVGADVGPADRGAQRADDRSSRRRL